jgi:hypothetical protein
MLRIRKQLAAPVIQAAYRAWMARRMSANMRAARFLLLRYAYVWGCLTATFASFVSQACHDYAIPLPDR